MLAVLCIITTLCTHYWYEDALHIVLMVMVLWVLAKHPQEVKRLCWRGWQMLRWLLIPTLVLHAIFTPGALIFPHFFMPISYEGLALGASLAWHWASVFTLAMVLGYLFPAQHWLNAMVRFPRLYKLLYPYLHLFSRMNLLIRALLRRHYRKWKKDAHKITQFPHYMLSLLQRMQYYSKRSALYLWIHWEQVAERSWTSDSDIKKQGLAWSIALVLLWGGVDMGVFH